MFRVAVNAVAALHLGDGGSRVGGGAQRVRVVPHAAAELDVVLVPVSPQNCLDFSIEKAEDSGHKQTLVMHQYVHDVVVYFRGDPALGLVGE